MFQGLFAIHKQTTSKENKSPTDKKNGASKGETMATTAVNVLGTEYTIKKSNSAEDANLIETDGYCDPTTKSIVIKDFNEIKDLPLAVGDTEEYSKQVYRHELIHAFLSESGLQDCSWAAKEEIVDWIACQFPKMLKAFEEVKCI